MTVRQAGKPVSDAEIGNAKKQSLKDQMAQEMSWWTPESKPIDRCKCRLYPKLSFFFDGTGNNLQQELRKPEAERALSNVAKLYLAAINDKDGKEAVSRYFSGVGTPYHYPYSNIGETEDRGGLMGMGFGAGGELRLKAALHTFSRILESEYSAGALPHMQWVTLSVFGFSRGATSARAFVRRLIAEQCERTAEGLIWKSKYGVRVPLRIAFLGLFDTVASVGGPGLHLDWGAELAIPQEMERCLHLVSGHEVRQAFPLDSVRVGNHYPANCEEVVYPGVHSNVGGGYANGYQGRTNLLSRFPLREMYVEALKSGVMLKNLSELKVDVREELLLPENPTIVDVYTAYMAALPAANGNLEALIHAHRTLQFQWRASITHEKQDTRVLGSLYRAVDPEMCAAVPAKNLHKTCPPKTWQYELSKDINVQAKQLLAEHRRLAQHIPFLREPFERQGEMEIARARTPYEELIVSTWDNRKPVSEEVELLLAGHVHDSVAHFTDWPCALHDQRGIYCDRDKIFAENKPLQSMAVG